MKIRSRLIIAFFIITLFPLVIASLTFHIILKDQKNTLAHSYHVNLNNYNGLDIVLNPFDLFSNLTVADYTAIQQIAETNPNQLLQTDYLAKESKKLAAKNSFLIIRRNGKDYYVGNEKQKQQLSSLPFVERSEQADEYTTFFDQKSFSIVRVINFVYSDQSQGQVLLVTSFAQMIANREKSIIEILIAVLLILLISAILLIIWIYESIVRPLNVLRIATTQIGNGNLEQPIPSSSSDEIGQLCHDFDEMRIRLKNMIEKSISSEENIREIISSISHDLKTPITAIKGYTEGIIDGVANTPEKLKKYLQTIYAKANDITYLIDELSIFSKVEQNSLVYNFIAVNLEDYFTDCISDISLDLESQKINVEYINTTDKDTRVLVDPEQLKRVLHNIIDNAAKYLDKPNGLLTICITDVYHGPTVPPLYRQLNNDGTEKFPPPASEEFIQVEIRDNGPGIAKEDLPYIFDRFYRADTSRNSSKRSSGIGLAIARVIITEHGGQIWAESTPGNGSSFFFTLKKESQSDNRTLGGMYE